MRSLGQIVRRDVKRLLKEFVRDIAQRDCTKRNHKETAARDGTSDWKLCREMSRSCCAKSLCNQCVCRFAHAGKYVASIRGKTPPVIKFMYRGSESNCLNLMNAKRPRVRTQGIAYWHSAHGTSASLQERNLWSVVLSGARLGTRASLLRRQEKTILAWHTAVPTRQQHPRSPSFNLSRGCTQRGRPRAKQYV